MIKAPCVVALSMMAGENGDHIPGQIRVAMRWILLRKQLLRKAIEIMDGFGQRERHRPASRLASSSGPRPPEWPAGGAALRQGGSSCGYRLCPRLAFIGLPCPRENQRHALGQGLRLSLRCLRDCATLIVILLFGWAFGGTGVYCFALKRICACATVNKIANIWNNYAQFVLNYFAPLAKAFFFMSAMAKSIRARTLRGSTVPSR